VVVLAQFNMWQDYTNCFILWFWSCIHHMLCFG